MKKWTQEQIEEADYYGVNLFNRNGIPMCGDYCEICHEPFIREVTENCFPRYCDKCVQENPKLYRNENRGK